MTSKEFENYTLTVINQLKLTENARVEKNARLKGVRQSGTYEIDIAVYYRVADLIDIKLLIECKNWGRPVDRPVIQKIVQTKDAVSAHKAAVVSPVGFTKEARDVAKDLGVALWVLSIGKHIEPLKAIHYCLSGEQLRKMLEPDQSYEAYESRKALLSGLGYIGYSKFGDAFSLADFSSVTEVEDENLRLQKVDKAKKRLEKQEIVNSHLRQIEPEYMRYQHTCFHNMGQHGMPGFDTRLASTEILNLLLGCWGGIIKFQKR